MLQSQRQPLVVLLIGENLNFRLSPFEPLSLDVFWFLKKSNLIEPFVA
jgi:hypothetical protein